jgi:hemerythrin
MALIEWNSGLSVNVGEIDRDHKELVRMINDLNQAMKDRKGKEVLGGIVSSLAAYATTHFAREEKYFDKFTYPARAGHKKEHDDFVHKVSGFQKGFEDGQIALSVEVMRFLSDWLTGHIMGSDKKYSALFNEKGLR